MSTAVSITKEAFNRPQNLQVLKQMGQSIKSALADAMPDFMRKEAPSLLQALYTECQTQPALMNCTPLSLFAAVIQAGRCGLKIGGALGQCYIIPFKGKATFIPGYKGLIQLVNRSGQVGIINAQTVYDKDEFDVNYGTSPTIKHVRGKYETAESVHARKSVAFYATCQTKQGVVFEAMTRAEAEVHRDRFAMARKEGQIVGPWRDHFDEMAKKTCIRKLCKYLPMSDTVMNAVAIDEAAESGGESYDASFLFAETVPELASGESESKVDQLRERVTTVTKPKEIITESGEVVIPPTREVTHDMLAGLLVEIEKRGGLATFYEQQQTDDMAIANMSKPSRSKLCTAANAFLTTLIQDAGE